MRHFFGRFDSNGAKREGGPDALLAPAYDILTMSVMPELKLGPTYLRTTNARAYVPTFATYGSAREQFWTRVLERVRALPGVRGQPVDADAAFGTTAADIYVVSAGVLATAGVAAWMPTRRACSIDPSEVLRCE